jgi:large subunit ribosomal protein L25
LELLELKADIRTKTGKSPARSLRRDNKIPAILYGPGTEAVMIAVGQHDLELAIKKSTAGQVLVNLVIQDGKTFTKSAMIKEMQVHPVTNAFIHVDFFEIKADRKIRVNVPIITTGKCEGVERGGMLQLVRRELEVLCMPGEIPESIEIDVTALDIGDSVHVFDIPLEGNIEVPTEANFTVLTVTSAIVEEEEVVEEDELEGEALEEGAETESTEATE